MLKLGAGGAQRGPGAAPMIWGDETEGDPRRFEAKSLRGARYLDPESSAPRGEGLTNPEADPTREGAGLVEVEGSGGGAAWKRRLAPHHRRAVRDFFAAATRENSTGSDGESNPQGEEDSR